MTTSIIDNELPPSIVDGNTSAAENIAEGTFIYNVNDSFTASDLDRDGEALTYSITGGNLGGVFEIDSATGVITIAAGKTLNYEALAEYNLTISASDGVNTDTATITVNVSDVNEAPSAVDDSGSVDEGLTSTVLALSGVLSNDTDVDAGDIPSTFTVTEVAGVGANVGAVVTGTYGDLTLNADGGYSYFANNANTLAAGITATDSFTYTMQDADGLTSTATLTITITGTDDEPVFSGATSGFVSEDLNDASEVLAINQNTAISGNLLSGTNGTPTVTEFTVDGNTYAASGTVRTITDVGTITINTDGSYTFTPDSAYLGAVPVITYIVTDGTVEDSSTLTLTVTAPVVGNADANETISTNKNTVTSGNVLSGTSGSPTLATFTVAGNVTVYNAGQTAVIAGVGTLQMLMDGGFTFTPATDYTGSVPLVTYVLGSGEQSQLQLSVTDTLTATGTLTVTDPDSDESLIDTGVAVVSVTENLGSLVIDAAGNWTYSVSNDAVQYLGVNDTRTEVFTVTTVDGSTQDITVTINGNQDDPTAESNIIPIPKDTTRVLTVDDFGINDPDQTDVLEVQILTLPPDGALWFFDGSAWVEVTANDMIPVTAIENQQLVFIPANGDTGNESFTFTLTDGDTTTAVNTMTFSINTELSVSSPLPVDEGRAAVFVVELSAERLVDTVLTFTLGGEAVSGTDYIAAYEYRVQNSDGSYTAWQTVSGNQATLLAGDTKMQVRVKTLVNDDGVDVISESLTLTATTTAAADLANNTATGATSINDLPSLLVSGASYVGEGNTTIFALELSSVKATDTEVTLSFEGVATPGALADYEYSLDDGVTWLSLANNTITLAGSATSNPTAEIQVRTRADATAEVDELIRLVATTTDLGIANNGVDLSASTLIVDPISISTNEDTTFVVTPASGDSYSLLGQPLHGQVVDNLDGTVSYIPSLHYSGSDTFTVTKTNEVGLSVTSVVTVNVTGVVDAPNVFIDITDQPANATTSNSNVIVNGDFSAALSPNWVSSKTSSGSFGLNAGQLELSTGSQNSHTAQSQQVINGLTNGQSYTFTVAVNTAPTIGNGIVSWNGSAIAPTSYTGGVATFTVTAGATNTLLFRSPPTANNVVLFDNVTLNVVNVLTYTYTVNASAELVDTNGGETLGNNITITSSNLPAGAVMKLSDGTTLVADNDPSGAYSWTVTRAQATGLLLTVNKSTGTQFTLTATATSTENSGTAQASATTATITMPASGTSTPNPVPVIDDATATLSNLVQTQNITTDFGDGTNVFSWVSVTDSLPEIFANGELVEYTLTVSPDGQVGTVTGTTSAGTVFSLVITLPAVDGQPAVATYTQFMSLQGEMVTSPGESMVSGGGNGDDLTLTFDAGGGETFSAVVTGENYVDGTATTINTNNKYIGAANNLMNPGEQVTMNFASGDIINAVASMQISFFNFDSESRVAPDELTIYGTTVDGSQFTLIVTNASLDASGKYTIVAPDNALIKELVFEAGIESSFKLGIESVSSVVYDPAFTLDLEYQLTDASGDSDTGTIALTLGGGDAVIGTAGDDTLLGTSFADIISGGAGDDTLTGGAGNDVFKWALADAGTTGAPAVDVITDFNTAANTDKLDLRDLLPDGLTTPTTLDNYLHFEYTGGNTIVHISTTGGFGDGNAVGVGSPGISVASETQQIVLSGVNLTTGGLTTDQQIIQNLITNQKLITD